MDFHRTCRENLVIRWDVGYVIYQCFFTKLTNFKLFLVINTIFCLYIKFYKADYRNFQLIIYILILLNTFELQQIKGALCSSILLYTYISFNNFKNVTVKILLASSFHLSSILLIVFLFIKRNIFLIIPLLLFGILLFSEIYPRYQAYSDKSPYLSIGRIIFIMISLLLIDLKENKNKIFILYPSIFYLITVPFFGVIPHRFYFLIYPIVIYNLVIVFIENKIYLKKYIAGFLISVAIISNLI